MSNPKDPDGFLSRQLIKLGDMMGDGLHYEPGGKWISQEYRKICKALGYIKAKPRNISGINERMQERVKTPCPECTGEFKQTKSGSKRAKCQGCGAMYQLLK